MVSEHPPPSRIEVLGGPAGVARGTLRDALGAVRNLAQLLHSVRVAPKSVSRVLPDVLEACPPMRTSVHTLLGLLSARQSLKPACHALDSFFLPRISELEGGLREAMLRPLNAKSRLALEHIVARSSFELDAARELLQLLEDAACERSMRLEPRELVREAFTAPLSARAGGRTLISAMLASHDPGQEIEINPRAVMVLVALGVELVGAGGPGEAPLVVISRDERCCSIRIARKAYATGEPLVLVSRGVVEPTLPCLRAAATITGGQVEWSTAGGEFLLRYPLPTGAASRGETA